MKTTRQRSQSNSKSRTRFSRVAMLLIFTLVFHAFENCTAHFGFPPTATSAQVFADCAHVEAASCDSCSLHGHRETDLDGCHDQSEIAVLTSPFSVEHLDLNFTTAVLPAPPHLIALVSSGSLLGRAQPPPTHFVSSSLRSSIPNRAPPLV